MKREYSARIDIDAPAMRVWEVLVDLRGYPAWNPFTPRAESTLEVGAPVTLHAQLGKRLVRQVDVVLTVEPGRELAWGKHMGHRRMLDAVRRQILTARPGGGCTFTSTDRLDGLLAPLVDRLYGRAIDAANTAMVHALKARVEASA